MLHQWLRVPALLILLFCGTNTLAQPLAGEQSKLAGQEQQLLDLQARQQQIQSEISRTTAELEPLLNQDSPEKKNLNAAQNELESSQATYQSDPSATNESRLKNNKFKLVLAERKFKKAHALQFSLQQQGEELSAQLTATHESIVLLTTASISQQHIAVKQTSKQQLAKQLALEKQQVKRKADAVVKEIAHLEALLKKQKQQEQAMRAALAATATASAAAVSNTVSASNPTITASSKPTASPRSTNSLKTDAASSSAAATTVSTTTAVASQSAPTKTASGAILLTTADQITQEKQRLKTLLATPENKNRSKYNKILNVKAMSSGRIKANTLRALGHNQYQGTTTLPAGEIIFVVGFNRWRQQIPASAANTEYTIIFDASNTKKPRFLYFQTSLSN